MKKLMIAAAIVCAAVAANAASVTWNSGVIYTPGADGKFTTTRVTSGSVDAYVWLVTSDVYSAATQATIAALDTKTANLSGKNTMLGATASLQDKSTFNPNDDIYSLVLYTYTDASDKTWTISNKATGKVDSLGSAVSFANLAGAGGTGVAWTHTGWAGGAEPEPTPEPTSAILMALGLAGLALRRKQK